MQDLTAKVDYLVEREKQRECRCSFTVAEWAVKWLHIFKKNNLRTSSFDKYSRTVKHIIKHFGDLSVSDFDILEGQMRLNSITSPSVKDDCHALLLEMFDKAVVLRYVEFNPIKAIEHKKHKKVHGKALTIEQEVRFVKACESHYRGLAFLICLYCGLRRGEVLALTADDIRIDEGYIVVNKQFQNGEITEPKTESGIREVPITNKLLPYLQSAKLPTQGRIFPIKEHALLEHFHNILKSCGLYGQGYTIHSLRHTYATRCFESGVARHITQKWVGHATADMTESVYTHANRDFELIEIEKLNKGVVDTNSQEKKTISA